MPDRRVQAAIDHWAPRFIAMGVDYNDFVRTTGRIERWEEWLGAWSAVADEHLELAGAAEAAGRARSAGDAYLHAALCLHFGKFVWVLDAAIHRDATERAIDALYRAHAHLDPSAERIEASLDGAPLAANLRRPAGVAHPPLVLLIPGLDSTKEEFLRWESVFLARGMATLSLDGPGQGETGLRMDIRPEYELAVGAILDAVAQRPELDPDRIGAVGVSLGGYYVVRAAAFETRIKALAGVSGPYDYAAGWDAMPSLTRETVVHHTGASSEAQARTRAGELNLDGVAERVTVPCLVVTGKRDRVIAWEQTKRIAEAVPGAEWVLYEDGTHVCNNIPYKYRPLVADWMHGRLSDGPPSP
jgi:2,6-dihydroxypseudooxynicotine hydrolase